MYYTEQINETMIKDFEKLTYTELRPLLYKAGGDLPIIAFGAFSYPAQPIGLILGEVAKDGCMHIYTIFVKPKYRRLGVATTLIKDLKQAAVSNKCHSISCGFIDDNPYHEIFNNLLQKCGWERPGETVMLLYKMDMESLLEEESPLFAEMELPAGLTVSSWQELSKQEFEKIKKGKGIWYPELTSPFLEEERVDCFNSVFLRDENREIIGWTITHRLDPETMLYRNIFVKDEYRSMGYAMLLMGNAIWRQYDRGIYKLMFCVHVKNKNMNRIVSRFMKPFNYTVKKKLQFNQVLSE
ncbi:MAG: GNAT family N-acetyltransferase [Clostridia bacterium]|nr:GNAT family N-acetyltransferase [Clostridia bacterium]MDD4048647.1 GNAT family N-acetyltransferase [Clostridia bacterium]